MIEYLAFVKKIGTTINQENIYEFSFTTVPEVVWGENFNIIPAGIIPSLTPEPNCISRQGRLITDLELKLACESTCFSMMDAIDGIIALCFTEPGIDTEFQLHFGERFEKVTEILNKHHLKLENLEAVKFNEETIIDDMVEKLKQNQGDDDDIDIF